MAGAVKACAYVQAIRKQAKRKGKKYDDLGHKEGPIAMEDALLETLKYVTKASDIACYVPDLENLGEWVLSSLPQEYLQHGIWNRSPRIFERVGAARSRWTPPEWCKVKEAGPVPVMNNDAASCSLDTSPITDGDSDLDVVPEPEQRQDTLRDLMLTMDLHRWLQVAFRRAISSMDHLQKALQAKGYYFPGDEYAGFAPKPSPEPDSGVKPLEQPVGLDSAS